MLVIDASAVIDLLTRSDKFSMIAEAIKGETLIAPELIDLEVYSAFARFERAGSLTAAQVATALAKYESFPLDRVSHRNINETAWQLRGQLRMADAYFAALTQLLGVVLLTTDVKLMRSGQVHCVKLGA